VTRGIPRRVRASLVETVERDHRQSDADFRRRQGVTAATTVVGAGLLAWGINAPKGGTAFYVATFLLAVTWTVGAFASGPLHLGHINVGERRRRPAIEPVLIGLALAALFIVGALVVREVPFLREQVDDVLDHVRRGSGPLTVLVTVVNGVAEELFFRGALYAAVPGRHQVLITTFVSTLVTLASGNVMLGFAALILGFVVGLQRRASGGVLAPIITHLTWSLTMLVVLPPLVGT
jgi:membrane protease YdiL (CAAX protease family)